MATPRRRKINVAANDVHPLTLEDTVVSDGFFSAKMSIFAPRMWEKEKYHRKNNRGGGGGDHSYDYYDDYCYCSGY